jgi:hypothetical protein
MKFNVKSSHWRPRQIGGFKIFAISMNIMIDARTCEVDGVCTTTESSNSDNYEININHGSSRNSGNDIDHSKRAISVNYADEFRV